MEKSIICDGRKLTIVDDYEVEKNDLNDKIVTEDNLEDTIEIKLEDK